MSAIAGRRRAIRGRTLSTMTLMAALSTLAGVAFTAAPGARRRHRTVGSSPHRASTCTRYVAVHIENRVHSVQHHDRHPLHRCRRQDHRAVRRVDDLGRHDLRRQDRLRARRLRVHRHEQPRCTGVRGSGQRSHRARPCLAMHTRASESAPVGNAYRRPASSPSVAPHRVKPWRDHGGRASCGIAPAMPTKRLRARRVGVHRHREACRAPADAESSPRTTTP